MAGTQCGRDSRGAREKRCDWLHEYISTPHVLALVNSLRRFSKDGAELANIDLAPRTKRRGMWAGDRLTGTIRMHAMRLCIQARLHSGWGVDRWPALGPFNKGALIVNSSDIRYKLRATYDFQLSRLKMVIAGWVQV